jgi:hypothetical protein
MRARMSGNEASAIGSLRAINSAQSTYSASCGGNGYAQTLADLAKAPAGSTQGFISPDLNADGVVKSGYAVNLDPGAGAADVMAAAATCNTAANAAVSTYFATANPSNRGTTGQRSFATDTRGTIYFHNTEDFDAEGDLAAAAPLP